MKILYLCCLNDYMYGKDIERCDHKGGELLSVV